MNTRAVMLAVCRWGVFLAVVAVMPACGGPHVIQNGSASSSASSSRQQPLDHVMPARDSIGQSPKRFAWTEVKGADDYSFGVWNEVDVLIYRENHVTGTSFTVPDDVKFEPGTYFWSISALHEGLEVADSGLAAFVVRTAP